MNRFVCFLILLALLAPGRAAQAGVWRALCERFLVTSAPIASAATDTAAADDDLENAIQSRILRLRHEAQNNDQFTDAVVNEYRRVGGRLYWLSRRTEMDLATRSRQIRQERYLTALSFHLRILGNFVPGELRQKVQDALIDYQAYEAPVTSH